jgi:hypothetical protein
MAPLRIPFKTIKLAIMSYLDNVLFAIVLAIGFGFFINIRKIIRNINLGIDVDRKITASDGKHGQ